MPKSENDVRLQAKLGSKNPMGLARRSSQFERHEVSWSKEMAEEPVLEYWKVKKL